MARGLNSRKVENRRAMLDPKHPGFAEYIHHQCLAVRDDPQEKEILDWIEAVSDFSGWK